MNTVSAKGPEEAIKINLSLHSNSVQSEMKYQFYEDIFWVCDNVHQYEISA